MSGSLRTPLGRVRGHGSAKAGTGHFIAQRVTAIALLLLAPYLVVAAALTMPQGYEGAYGFIAQPWIAAPLLLAILVALYHMRIGMQVVIEDYIERPGTKAALLILNAFVAASFALAAGYAIIKLSLGA